MYTAPLPERKYVPAGPKWNPPSSYRDKYPNPYSPAPLLPDKPKLVSQPTLVQPGWKYAGRPKYEPIQFFDEPSLRWSLKDLLRSMPELRPQTPRPHSSPSKLRSSVTASKT